MAEKFLGKYRITVARLAGWDYGADSAYFITICTHHHQCLFGTINDNIMALNEAGKLAEEFWRKIDEQFRFIELGPYVIMPNHIHGILIIN